MSAALALARKARFQTSPNPMVGAVLVRDGAVLGEGFHRRAGGAHAEIGALRQAGAQARGATLYVTLEPCSHHGRTSPCTSAIIAAGVTRVVVAMRDPDPRIDGRGVADLRAQGISVDVGDGAAEAEALNQRWLLSRRSGRPFVGLKFAATLDGKIAPRGGDSHWITGAESRRHGHLLRQAYDAVAVGAGTVIADDPELTARPRAGAPSVRQPLRVVVDGRLRVGPGARVFDSSLPGRSLLATTVGADRRRGRKMRVSGVDIRAFPGEGRVDIVGLLESLAADGVSSVLVEGGGDLGWSFVSSGTVDHVYAFLAPKLVGGRDAVSAVEGEGFADLAGALQLRFVRRRVLGDDMLLEAVPA
jgi:diaminohydroxyphosphoribosylaminopyrimidine deaminase/5-amino-6-(5-phosphoribosylamino)uracil reductase